MLDTKLFEELLQKYLQIANDDAGPFDYEERIAELDMAAYKALEEAAGLLGVSMLVKR